MARKASSSRSHSGAKSASRSGGIHTRILAWAKDHPEETKVTLISAAIALFFTQGLPLWDADYSTWLSQADQGWGNLLGRVLLPVTSDPGNWGYADRPLQALLYKIYFTVFGTSAFFWYFLKSSVFGALCGTLWHWMKKMDLDRTAMIAALALFVVSANVVTSLVWHSDWTVYSELVLVGVLFYSLAKIEKGPSSQNVYKKGFAGLPKDFTRFLVTFFAVVYFGAKLKGDVRMAPVILMSWMYLFRREKFHVYWPPFTVTLLATLPWSSEMFKHLPPFIPGSSGWQGATYAQFGVTGVFHALGSDLFNFSISHGPSSWLAASGIFMFLGILGYGAYRAYGEKITAPDEQWGFHLIWLAFALLGCSVLSPASSQYSLRFFFIPLVPTTFLLGMIMHSAIHEFPKFPQMRRVVVAIVAIQCVMHFAHSYEIRRELGHQMVATNQIHEAVDKDLAGAKFVYGPGFAFTGFSGKSSAMKERKALGNMDEIHTYPANQTYVAVWSPVLDPKFTVEKTYTGCGGAIFDVIAPCRAEESAHLLRYLGDVPEVVQAYQLENQGNFTGARQMLESYYQKDPNNLGVGFMIGLDAYKMHDMARMEQVYDQIGPSLTNNVSVVYNWGLAKQGVQKYPEAAKLFEMAYTQAPKDYGIGFNLADSYYREGKKSRALATLGDLMQVYPGNAAMKTAYESWQKN